ncbi:hypothetical protein U1Q18_042511 [Sarracenia purpurea var. burkii]
MYKIDLKSTSRLQEGTTIRGDDVVNFVQKVERDRSNPENGPVAQQNGAGEDEVGLAVSGYKFRSPDSFSESESVDQSASTTDQPRSQEKSVDTQLRPCRSTPPSSPSVPQPEIQRPRTRKTKIASTVSCANRLQHAPKKEDDAEP